MIIFVSAIAAGATGAFFSDTETSTGNTFTAGAIDLTVDSEQHYNNAVCVLNTVTTGDLTDYYWQLAPGQVAAVDQYPIIGSPCTGTWLATNLGAQFQFFNFGDVKPGDMGENTVSLHIENNPAWACAFIKTTGNNENDLIEPETDAGDLDLGAGNGELAENLSVFAWLDNGGGPQAEVGVGDNIWQANETVLVQPTTLTGLNATTTLALAQGGGNPLPGGSTSYIGLGWCAGTLTIGAPGSWTCNGATMGNVAQTDSATSTVSFYVEQARNNPNFNCALHSGNLVD